MEKNRKRIGLLISTLNSGGAERVVSHLSHILGDIYDVHVILFEDTYMEYTCAGTLHNLDIPAKAGSPLVKLKLLRKRIRKLQDLIKQEQLSCVISFLESPNFVNLMATAPGCRKILSIRNFSSLENRSGLLSWFTEKGMKQLYRRADAIVTVSELIRQDFIGHFNIPADKIVAIYNPYNFREMLEKGELPLSEEEKHFLDGKFVFMNVGRIMYQKAVWHLLKAFSLVCKDHPASRLTLVGENISGQKVMDLIENLGIRENVLMVGRTRNPYQYMKNADCYVLSSLFEGFPNAMVEGMACGCATVAADCMSGPREILYENADLGASIDVVTEADFGILVPALEPEENWDSAVITEGEKMLAQAMIKVLTDPEKCRELAQKAQQRSRTFDYDAAREAFKCVIEGKQNG